MTVTEYQEKLISYLKDKPSEAALEMVAKIVNDWTEGAYCEDWGEKLHEEIFGPPVECVECGSINYVPGACWGCEKGLGS